MATRFASRSGWIASPRYVSRLLLRIGFGLSLLFIGISHYKDIAAFADISRAGLGVFAPIGALWAYILPLLMIFGGLLYIANFRPDIAAWLAGVALASMPVGMILKSVMSPTPLDQTITMATYAFVWLLVYTLVSKWTEEQPTLLDEGRNAIDHNVRTNPPVRSTEQPL